MNDEKVMNNLIDKSMSTHTNGYENPSNIIDRFNAAIRHQYDSKKHHLEGSTESYKREVCAFANAINEVTEWVLRYFIIQNGLPKTCRDDKGVVIPFNKCNKFHLANIIIDNSSCNKSQLNYFHQNIGKMNDARHRGNENDYKLCCEYIEKVRLFVNDNLSIEGLRNVDNIIDEAPDWDAFYQKCKRFKKNESH